jgi:hypothetical protein
MKRLIHLTLFSIFWALTLLEGQGALPPQKGMEQVCPDTIGTTGKYVNYSYGFSIVIPKGLKGEWNSARCVAGSDGCVCMSDHGRLISLATGPNDTDHWIEAYAGFASDPDDPTLENEVASRLGWIRDRSRDGSVSVLQRSGVTIGGLKGKRVVARYYDKQSNRVMVEDFVEAVKGKRVEYSLYLRTPVEAYPREKAIFDTVLRSFALRKCGNC